MWTSCMDAMYLRRALCLCVLLFMGVCCHAFELQDMIHTLIEENIHLHDQLENLTAALRELRQLLLHHSSGHSHEPEIELHHRWQEWSQHNISPETHVLLEHALCGHELHGFAVSAPEPMSTILTFIFIILTHLLL